MTKIRPALLVLLLAASAASLGQADARQRGGKQTIAGRHGGVTAPVGGGVTGRGRALPVIGAPPAFTKTNPPPVGIGSPKAGPATISGPNAIGAAKSNPIGARPGTVAIPRAPGGMAKVGPVTGSTTFVRSATPTTTHGAGITGTGIKRPGTMPGVVGGPAKVAGGITGTGMKPKK